MKYAELSYKCLCFVTNLVQSHVEFYVRKKLSKNNNMNLAAVSFVFIGKITKANEFFVQDSLDKHYSICKPPISRPEIRYWCEGHQQRRNFMIVYI